MVIRHISVELEVVATSSLLRATHRPVTQWIVETAWIMVHPSSAENEEARQRGAESSVDSRLALRAKPVTMHLSKLPHLRQALQLVGLVAKTARH